MVAGELHRAQQQVGDELLLGLALDLAEDELEVLGADGLEVGRHAVPERRHELHELDDPLRVGPLVDAVEGAGAGAVERRRHGLVRGQHELLDEAHAVEALVAHDARHLPRFVEDELRLRQVEVERAALVAALAHQLRELVHRQQRGDERGEGPARFPVAVHDRLGLRVGEAGRTADDAVVEGRLLHAPAGVEVDHDGLGEPVPALDEAADVARERVRQHRHDPVGEVDRRAAEVGLLVERPSFAHVVRDVGDVHREAIASVGPTLDSDGVVVVARRLRVDGDGEPAPEVGSPRHLAGADRGAPRGAPLPPLPGGRRRAARTWRRSPSGRRRDP